MTATKKAAPKRAAAPAGLRPRRPLHHPDPRLDALRKNIDEIASRLAKLNTDSAEDDVHRLRTGTRRAGALLQSLIHDSQGHRKAQKLAELAATSERQWKKLRRAAGAVRDLDVHLAILEQHGKELETFPPAYIGRLRGWLRSKRADNAAALQKVVSEHHDKAVEAAGKVLEHLQSMHSLAQPNAADTSPALLALATFAAASAEFPLLNRGNLHEFRKRTKRARYIAESSGKDRAAQTISRELKRIQDDIGQWHDYEELTSESQVALDSAAQPLQQFFREHADLQFEKAMATSNRERAQLIGRWTSTRPITRK